MGISHAPLIQMVINKVWSKNKEDDGVIHLGPTTSADHPQVSARYLQKKPAGFSPMDPDLNISMDHGGSR